MKEDVKAKLKAKLVGDKELDNVAGGSASENAQLLAALAKVDPERVNGVFEAAAWFNNDEAINDIFNKSLSAILKENFGNSITIENSIDGKNKYTHNGKPISHSQMLEFLDSQGWVTI